MKPDSVFRCKSDPARSLPVAILLLVLSIPIASPSGQADTEPGLEMLRGFLESVQTMSAAFEQELFDADLQSIEVATGTLKLMRPGRFRWTYQKPYERIIVADGERVWMYDTDLEQVTVRDLDAGIGGTPVALLIGDLDVLDNFAVAETTQIDDILWLQLVPVEADGDFERISLGFSGNRLVRLELKDRLGQTSRVEFTDIELNPRLDSDEFRFNIPDGADVIDESAI
jgi:outer membrane lipoprotein carrier protein